MKIRVLIFIGFFVTNTSAQQRWFTVLPGPGAKKTFIYNDTLITFGLGQIGSAGIILKHHSNSISGALLYTDTIDYFDISGDSTQTNEIYNPNQYELDSSTGRFSLGFSYTERIKGKYRWRSGIFSTNPFKKLLDVSKDTFDTKLNQYTKIGANYYVILVWIECITSSSCRTNYRLIKLKGASNPGIVKQQINPVIIQSSHAIEYEEVHEDNKNRKYLFLQQWDRWEFAGGANAWQGEIVKMDTNGSLQWKCRPNINDSVNTSYFRMVQKPDGNIICCWTDDNHPPHKHPAWDNFFADRNDSSTLWFAEIDYQTGQVKWRKNIKPYLRSNLLIGTKYYSTQNVYISDAKVIDDHIVWTGNYLKTDTFKPYGKNLTVLMKTDFNANPIWLRQHDLFPRDTGDKGMSPYSFIPTRENKGFILTGDYENRYGQASNGEFWYKGALLRLDKNGCLQPDCDPVTPVDSLKQCKVYPNPTNQQVIIELFSNFEDWKINIFDVQGRLLEDDIPLGQKHIKNIDNYPGGLYIMQLSNAKTNERTSFKIIINH
jgi:hypothetical protein